MASSNPNQQGPPAYLINPYGKPMSRLVRTKDTHQENSVVAKTNESAITQPSLLVRKGRNEQSHPHLQKLLPSKVSDLSPNIVFQDMDTPTKSISKASSKQQQSADKDKQVKPQMIGLIGNVFMQATTKYTKVPQEQIITPTKDIYSHQADSNANGKFSRRRDVQPNKLERHSEMGLDLNSVKTETKMEGWTDRSTNENNHKIERKTDRNRRQLKFGQKKQTKHQNESQTLSQLGEQSRVLQNNIPATASKEIHNEPHKIETPLVKPKPYQPIRRSNAQTPQVQQINNASYTKPSTNYRPIKQSTELAQQQKSQTQSVRTQQFITPKKQQIKVQPIAVSTVKKSALVCFAVKRLLSTQLAAGFSQLKLANYQLKIKTSRQSLLLGQAVLSICHHKDIGLMRWSFDSLKHRFSQKYVTQLKNELLYKQPNRNQIGMNLLQKIYQSKLHCVWQKLKHKHLWYRQQIQSINIFDHIYKKKVAQLQHIAVAAISRRAKTTSTLLNSFNLIVSNLNKHTVSLAFLKLLAAVKPKLEITTPQKKIATKSFLKEPMTPRQSPQPTPVKTNPALLQKTDKLKAIVSSVQDNLSLITKKLKEAQQQSSQQKQELQQKVINLKQANQQIESQLQSKKGRIELIQKQLNNINSKVQSKPIQDDLEIQTQDNNLQKLAKVYMENYKNREELITTTEILEEYQLGTDQQAKPIMEWQLLADNMEIKRLIAAYEQQAGPVEFKARKMALGQQQVAAKLVCSYIKEQYFWQWLHLTAESMSCK